MGSKLCFEQGCKREAQYTCQCASSNTHLCELHLEIEFLFLEPHEGAKDAVLSLLEKEKLKKEKLKNKFLDSFSQNFKIWESSLQESLRKIDLELLEICSLMEKISQTQQISKFEEDPILKVLTLQPEIATKRVKEMIPINPEPYISQCSAFNQPLSHDYLEYIDAYHQITSLYLIRKENDRTKLFIYDTESKREEVKMLDTPEPLNWNTCITQLPNGELFCFGNYPESGITLIIDKNYGVRVLPSGTPCWFSSGTYFNGCVYCFGGLNKCRLTLSRKFDLNENRWIDLISMPRANWGCHSVTINGNILISGYVNRNLLLYAIDIDSFSTIPYQFAGGKRKILINIERFYLIECGYNGLIYESEAGDVYAWKQISNSLISYDFTAQVYCSYNKGGIYIAAIPHLIASERYFKFDLTQKIMIEL